MRKYRTTDEPLLYTGIYDKEVNRRTKALNGRRPYNILQIIEID